MFEPHGQSFHYKAVQVLAARRADNPLRAEERVVKAHVLPLEAQRVQNVIVKKLILVLLLLAANMSQHGWDANATRRKLSLDGSKIQDTNREHRHNTDDGRKPINVLCLFPTTFVSVTNQELSPFS